MASLDLINELLYPLDPLLPAIKVYATTNIAANWTDPQCIHLHEKTASGRTVCSQSFTAGGIVEDSFGTFLFVTSDWIIPTDKEQYKRHIETTDGDCFLIDEVKHTNHDLRYSLVTIDEFVAETEFALLETLRKTAVDSDRAFHATMHPIHIKVAHWESELVVVARTRHNELIKGRIIALPSSADLTSSLFYDGPMVAEFARSPAVEQIDAGMWVYARRHRTADPDPAVNEKLQKLDRGPYDPIVFSYERYDSPERHPLVLIGHIEEVRNRSADPNRPVEVTMRSLHMALSDIFKRNRWQDDPDGSGLPRFLRNVCTITVLSVEGGGSSS